MLSRLAGGPDRGRPDAGINARLSIGEEQRL